MRLDQLREIHSRRFNMQRTAIEIFLTDQTNYFINFSSSKVSYCQYCTQEDRYLELWKILVCAVVENAWQVLMEPRSLQKRPILAGICFVQQCSLYYWIPLSLSLCLPGCHKGLQQHRQSAHPEPDPGWHPQTGQTPAEFWTHPAMGEERDIQLRLPHAPQ